MNEEDVQFAQAAFSDVLPEIKYRSADASSLKLRSNRWTVAKLGVPTIALTALAVVLTSTTSTPAWSATPSLAKADKKAAVDRECRAARTQVIVVGPGVNGQLPAASADGGVTVITGSPAVGGVNGSPIPMGTPMPVESGAAVVSALPADSSVLPGVPASGVASKSFDAQVGDLSMLLLDVRGKMSLALYGDESHHVICTINSDGVADVSINDESPWPQLRDTELITANSMMLAGTTVVAGSDVPGTVSTAEFLGRIAPNVKAMFVDVPGIGRVDATISDGYYSVFIPNNMIASGLNLTTWNATLELNDGTTVSKLLV